MVRLLHYRDWQGEQMLLGSVWRHWQTPEKNQVTSEAPRAWLFLIFQREFLQQNAASGENSVISGWEGENEANNQEISVLSGPPLNSEQDTAVDFVSDAPSERAITFNDNPVDRTRYIPLRLWDTPQEPRPLPAELPFDPMTPAADCHSKAGDSRAARRGSWQCAWYWTVYR